MTKEVETLPVRPFDARLIALKAEGMSMEEISERLNGAISPAQAGDRIKQLFKMKDWLTAAEEDQALMLEFRRILTTLKERYEDNDNLTLQIKVLDKLSGRLDKRREATNTDLNTYSQNIGRQIGRVVDNAMSYMQGALRDQIDPDIWDELKKEALQHARSEIAKNELEE